MSVAKTQTLRTHHPDYVIALIITILLAIGLVMLYSVSPILSQKLTGVTGRNYYFINQLMYVGIGIVAWIVATAIPYHAWRKYAVWLLGASILAMLALAVPGLGRSALGATRWLKVGPFQVQPAEILKLSLILYLAAWFERRSSEVKSFVDGVIPFVIMVGSACFVIAVLQRDMGTMMVLAFAAIGMLFTAGVKWTHLGVVLGTSAIGAGLLIAAFPHRLSRLAVFLNPTADAMGSGYHINQALIAVGSGGFFGLGLGHSIQVYGYLPEAANDSIFAIIAEEFGFIGSLAVIVLFGLLIYRGLQVARSAPDMFGRLVATGITLWLLFQAAINIGAMLSLLPLTGIPLPFISYGGTSLVISLFGAGILLNISKYTTREEDYADRSQRGRVGGAYNPNARRLRKTQIAR
ncbi:putative lipid II flippase FtsW [Candidatus Saccharibacteria bacterium]|nr:putative lipid II flippase FtsW [Candidatus Saccharibacteria bacterium]